MLCAIAELRVRYHDSLPVCSQVVRIVIESGTIDTLAGTGADGDSGDGAAATSASLSGPYGVCASSTGAIYVADSGNNRVRVVATDGTINAFAGTLEGAGGGGDGGPATLASLSFPRGCAVGPAGDVYIADTRNNRVRMVRVVRQGWVAPA